MARSPVLNLVFLAAVCGSCVPHLGSAQPMQTEIQHAVATPYSIEDPDMAGFRLRFDLRLTSGSTKAIDIPKSGLADDGVTRVSVLGVQARGANGTWKYVVRSSWYDFGTIKYESCTPLASGGSTELKDIGSGLALLRKQLAELGDEPTIRFNITLFCRQPDGKVITTETTTDAFRLRLPAR